MSLLWPLSVLFLATVFRCAVCDVTSEPLSLDDIKLQLQDVKHHLERFNAHYLMNLEQRIVGVLTTLTSLDANVKTLQEKSQVWDVFQHHIGAWSEHIKSVDSKLDLLKKAHESPPAVLETRLSNLDFKVQHVFEKVDIVNEKLHDITKTVYAMSSNSRGRRNDRTEASGDQAAVLTKITNLQKQFNRLEQSGQACSKRNGANGNGNGSSNGNGNGNGSNGSAKIKKEISSDPEDEIDDFLDKLTTKKLKDLIASRRNGRSLDNLTTLVRSVEERTIRIYDLEANQFEQILSCCKRTNNEVTTFTNSADILLKRIEGLVLDVDGKIEKRNHQQCRREEPEEQPKESTIPVQKPDKDDTVDIGSGSEGNPSWESSDTFELVTKTLLDDQDEIVFHHPDKEGCHQLSKRMDGVYTFGEVDLNEARRDFNRRFCKFATDGPAWTVFQHRGLNDIQEHFNRSWTDYKNGFGNLGYEFWLGNNYIHRLSYDDNVELRIEVQDFEGHHAFAEYGTFRIESEKFNFNLMIADYRGNASDGLLYHNDQDFSTYDHSNDQSNGTFPCALTYGSGWWFNSCAESNLNGMYYIEHPKEHKSTGILWEPWLGDYSLKSSSMMLRPKYIWLSKDGSVAATPPTHRQDP